MIKFPPDFVCLKKTRLANYSSQLSTDLSVEMHQEILTTDFKGKHLCTSLGDQLRLSQEASVLK